MFKGLTKYISISKIFKCHKKFNYTKNCDTVHPFDAHDDNADDDVDDNIDVDEGETFYVNSITTNCNRVQLSKLHLDLVRMPETVFTTVMVMKKGSKIELAAWVQFQKW